MEKPGEERRMELPGSRKIRRSCQRELYRTIKRLNMRIPPRDVAGAEQLYFSRVIANLDWIAGSGGNRKKLADWWEKHVAPDIAELWNVDAGKLSRAFRDAFGG